MKNIGEVTNEVLLEWAAEFIEFRRQAVRKAKLEAGGALRDSFQEEVAKATANDVARAYFAFEDYGRILDMRRIRRSKQTPVSELEQWVKEVGVEKFRSRFTQRSRLPVSNERLANMVAWGIARSAKRRRRRWYSKDRERSFGVLYARLREGYMEAAAGGMKDSLLNKKS